MIKQWLAIFLLLAFSPSLHALSSAEATLAEYERSRLLFPQGVRSVGNGGGFGEMQAIFANLQLPSLLRTRLGSAPSLSPEIYKKIVEAVADDAPFAISPACGMAPIQFSMGKLLLGSCALYEVSDSSTVHVKDFAAIAAWVLAAKLMHRGAALLRA